MADSAATPVGPQPHQLEQTTAPHAQVSSDNASPTLEASATHTNGQPRAYGSNGTIPGGSAVTRNADLDIICGPLINYRRMSNELTDNPIWHGSVLIVVNPGSPLPTLRLSCVGPVDGSAPAQTVPSELSFPGVRLYEDPRKAFWRFMIDLPILPFEANWQYSLVQPSSVQPRVFTVPSNTQSMRILFHSCNGFSVGADEDAWCGPALWNDVVRFQQAKPFHVMIGGGDQLYQDNVRVTGPLKPWTEIKNPRKRREYQFVEDLRQRCDEHYYSNYIKWYGTEPFKSANCVIPQINIWDDHDIIDGFGSYTDNFMKCHVFRGIGGIAHKYYVLFQHHLAPPKVTFTSDTQSTEHEGGSDPVQEDKTFVLTEETTEPQYIVGMKPGPYVEERSRSIFCQLGARIGFLGVDARLERTRRQINYPETYDLLFKRLEEAYTNNKSLKHLIILLGVPIAYPRLQWLENIFTSPIIGPIRFLNKRFGFAGGLFNKFDGQVDLLDDLDDHYTARQHKLERRVFIHRLQAFSKEHSARVTILGGDVHLAAMGRFYSNPKLKIPSEHDWRYMTNIISSAITNKPPPSAIANLLARRNKIHHLDDDTDETLMEMFNHDPGMGDKKDLHKKQTEEKVTHHNLHLPKRKTTDSNKVTMPSRNYAIIAESGGANRALSTAPETVTSQPNDEQDTADVSATSRPWHPSAEPGSYNMRKAIHEGERNAGTQHLAASGLETSDLGGSFGLDVTLRVEISNKDPNGMTEGYGFTIPGLDSKAYADQGTKW